MKKLLILITVVITLSIAWEGVRSAQAPQQNLQASILTAPVVIQPSAQEEAQQQVHVTSPETATLIGLLELTVEEERNYSKGLSIIEESISSATNDKLIELYKAKILSRSLEFGKAQQLLEGLDDQEIAILKAAVLIALNDRDRAGAHLHDLVDNHPDRLVKLQALALLNVYHSYDKHRDADESYLWTLFAQQLAHFGEAEISHYLAQKATEKNPNYRDAWIIKGFDEYTLKRHFEAEESLLTAYQLDPGNVHIQYLLGLTYFEQEKAELSNQYLLYAQQNNSKYQTNILEKLAENAISLADYPLAGHYFESVLEFGANQQQSLSRLVWLYTEELGDLDKALDYAQKLADLAPSDPNSFHLLSWVHTKREEFEEATEYLNLANSL